jgi:hypothetical protein
VRRDSRGDSSTETLTAAGRLDLSSAWGVRFVQQAFPHFGRVFLEQRRHLPSRLAFQAGRPLLLMLLAQPASPVQTDFSHGQAAGLLGPLVSLAVVVFRLGAAAGQVDQPADFGQLIVEFGRQKGFFGQSGLIEGQIAASLQERKPGSTALLA